ncbi:hypothetical protein [Frigoriglobus tundricola]|uniref:Uncharacterized protein n=1 Tax=Frigoriglobus tundricola TaxID=2774151 RepID=A0A6M5YNR0_9BACT|nr:hypothetical protein [Frigoriglobus tundricola]QJW95697.1 hypothetical protein FTUN_3251 [Frigoriglobus tundricola]
MSAPTERVVAVVVRVASPGQPAFQLRKGEHGISVFDPAGGDPPLTEDEILAAFRPGSVVIFRTVSVIEEHGLLVIPTAGAESLPERLRTAHCEIEPGIGMDRPAFKAALRNPE